MVTWKQAFVRVNKPMLAGLLDNFLSDETIFKNREALLCLFTDQDRLHVLTTAFINHHCNHSLSEKVSSSPQYKRLCFFLT